MHLLKLFIINLVIAPLLSCSKVDETKMSDSDIPKEVTVRISFGEKYGLDARWQDASSELEKPSIDVYFLLSDGRNFHDIHSVQLEYPDIKREFEDRVSTAEVIGNEQLLVNYYKQLFVAAREYEIPFTEISHKFWLRLKIQDRFGATKFNFSGYDTLEDILKYKEWVDLGDENILYSEMYQGWAMEGQIKNSFAYLIEYDPDYDAYSENSFISYEHLNNELTLAVGRAQIIVKVLTESLGTDVWSRYRGYPWDNIKL